MKDVISFCNTACVKYQIPVLLLSTREMSTNIFQKFILVDPPPIVGQGAKDFKEAVDYAIVKTKLANLYGSPLYFSDKKKYSEEDILTMNIHGAKIVFIDDNKNVPSQAFLENWGKERNIQVIMRTE